MNAEPRLSPASIAVALAAGLALFTYANGLANPAAAAETGYLALWVTCTLAALAGVAATPAYDLAAVAVLTTTAVWVVPHGPTRGAAVGLLLTLAVAFIEIRRFDRIEGRLTWTWAVASALALQFLCRADRFLGLAFEPKDLVGVVGLPVLAAAAFQLLQSREGILPALLAVMTVALLVPGWSVIVVLSLLAVVTGILWRDRLVPRWLVVVAALALILAGDSWAPSLAWLLLFTMAGKAIRASRRSGLVAVAVTALLVSFLPEARPWSEVVRWMALGPILLPALLLPSDSRRAASVQAFVIAVLALRTVDGPAALAAPLILAALSLRASAVAARFQLVWTGTLLAAVTLLGGYPWLRSPALADALGLFGIEIRWIYAVAVVFVIWLLTFLCAALVDRTSDLRCRPILMEGAILAVLVWIAMPSSAERPLGERIHVLDETRPVIGLEIEPAASTRSLVIDTYLENAATLLVATPVARVTMIGSDAEQRSWILRAGIETGEWAARREDVATLEGFQAPRHWLAWVAPGGDLMAQRYRALWELDRTIAIRRLEIERIDELPSDVRIAVFHLELRR